MPVAASFIIFAYTQGERGFGYRRNEGGTKEKRRKARGKFINEAYRSLRLEENDRYLLLSDLDTKRSLFYFSNH